MTDVRNLLDRLASPEEAYSEVTVLRKAGKTVPGFGHRVYRLADPRSVYLRSLALCLGQAKNDLSTLSKADALCEAMAPMLRMGIAPNVDLYAAVLSSQLGLSPDICTAVFSLARSAGWLAHITEQRSNNIIIRPLLAYKAEPINEKGSQS